MPRYWRRTAIRNRPWLAGVVLAVLCGYGASQSARRHEPPQPEAVSVCDLLKDSSAYRDRLVTVKGIYWYGLREDCPQPFITGGRRWPTAIDMVHSDFTAPNQERPPFKTDDKSWDRLELFVHQEAKAGRREEIWATVVGMLRAPVSYVRKDHQVAGGYRGYPAQLVVKTVLDISVKSKPTYDYRKLLRRAL